MTQAQLLHLEKKFQTYIGGFLGRGPSDRSPALAIKAEHCRRVAGEAGGLSADLHWPLPEQRLAQAAGWLHDIGRFSQFAEFGTFSDVASVDHGARGAAVLQESGWLSEIPSDEAKALVTAVRYHNRRSIPPDVRGPCLAHLKLIRDADKLDILRFVLDAVERDGFKDLPSMLPHIRLKGPVSSLVLDELACRQCVSLAQVASLADFLLMQLSWVYDLNYSSAFRRLHDYGIVPKIMSRLNGDPRIHAPGEEIRRFVWNRAKNEEEVHP